jgi:hypothetical protein
VFRSYCHNQGYIFADASNKLEDGYMSKFVRRAEDEKKSRLSNAKMLVLALDQM